VAANLMFQFAAIRHHMKSPPGCSEQVERRPENAIKCRAVHSGFRGLGVFRDSPTHTGQLHLKSYRAVESVVECIDRIGTCACGVVSCISSVAPIPLNSGMAISTAAASISQRCIFVGHQRRDLAALVARQSVILARSSANRAGGMRRSPHPSARPRGLRSRTRNVSVVNGIFARAEPSFSPMWWRFRLRFHLSKSRATHWPS
jgi:hypothetical protein